MCNEERHVDGPWERFFSVGKEKWKTVMIKKGKMMFYWMWPKIIFIEYLMFGHLKVILQETNIIIYIIQTKHML